MYYTALFIDQAIELDEPCSSCYETEKLSKRLETLFTYSLKLIEMFSLRNSYVNQLRFLKSLYT